MNGMTTHNDSICVLQITDTHLFGDSAQRLGDWDTLAALDAVLAHARRTHPRPHALLLTGDLVHDESAAGYHRLADRLRHFHAPVFAIPGNHDDPATMASSLNGAQVGSSATLGGWRVHLLDSRVAGCDGGRLGADQLDRLRDTLREPAAPTLIAVHHPPAPVGSDWLDAMRLADGDELLELAASHGGVRGIVSGHVHQAFDELAQGVRQLTTPATCRQFTPGSPEPAEDRDNAPGYRCLWLDPEGHLITRVYRVPAARSAALAADRT